MKQIAQFFTIFWIVYFPTCIAFYTRHGSWNIIDELMTVILIAFTFLNISKKYTVKYPVKEYRTFLFILTLFLLYGLAFGVNIKTAVIRDAMQWVRPFSVIYCTWILNPRFSHKQVKWMNYSMLITIFAYIVLRILPSSHDIESPELCQLALCTGMTWYLLKSPTKKNSYIALGIVLLGMLAPKFKYLGEVVCFVYLIFFLKHKFNFRSPATVLSLGLMTSAVLFVTWAKFDTYYIQGFSATEHKLARPETYKTAFQLLWDYFPFGPGMGSFSCAAAADYFSPLYYKYHLTHVWGLSPTFNRFVADCFYPCLAQFGIAGIWLFGVFWKRKLILFAKIHDLRYYRIAWMSFFCLLIEQVADTSFLSGKGMGYCMLIGLCLNANRNLGHSKTNDDTKNTKEVSDEDNNEASKPIVNIEK